MTDTAQKLPVALLVAPGFEEHHMTDAQKALLAVDRPTRIVTADGGLVQGWHQDGWGHHFMAEESLSDILSADYIGLIVAGGRRSIDTLRENPHALRVVKAFVQSEKPLGLAGEAVQLLVAADLAATRKLACPSELAEDVARAGAEIVSDGAVVVDGNLITTTGAGDMKAFLEEFLAQLERSEAGVEQAA